MLEVSTNLNAIASAPESAIDKRNGATIPNKLLIMSNSESRTPVDFMDLTSSLNLIHLSFKLP